MFLKLLIVDYIEVKPLYLSDLDNEETTTTTAKNNKQQQRKTESYIDFERLLVFILNEMLEENVDNDYTNSTVLNFLKTIFVEQQQIF